MLVGPTLTPRSLQHVLMYHCHTYRNAMDNGAYWYLNGMDSALN